MADGTLQITVAVDPRHATDAFKLLGMPGTPVALAALKVAARRCLSRRASPRAACWRSGLVIRNGAALPGMAGRAFRGSRDEARQEHLRDRVSRRSLDNDPVAKQLFKRQTWSRGAPIARSTA